MPASHHRPAWAIRARAVLRRIMWTGVLIAVLVMLWATNRPAPTEGRVLFVSDGDSFSMASDDGPRSVRLLGIDAPELAQTCLTAADRAWPCGTAARDAIKRLLPTTGPITCRSEGKDRFDRALSRCTLADGRDLAALLVTGGWAVSTTEDYLLEEDRARVAKIGIWQGDFLTPTEWRAANPRR
jgi:endonuclease YncB( thermonuclease family)